MKVFISWSGERSRLVGELLDDWLQCVLQALDPWMSSKDIDRGSLWFSEITDQLKDTTIGIILLTQENKEKPWILFESGALAKGLTSSRVCTFLIDLHPTDIRDPLAQFNHTYPTREGLWQLVRTLNTPLLEKGLKEKVLDRVFETYWPQFEESFKKILASTPDMPVTETTRSEGDMMIELLSSIRNVDKRIRSMEGNKNNTYDSNDNTLEPQYADLIIRRMVESGFALSAVHSVLSGLVPNRFIQSIYHRVKPSQNLDEINKVLFESFNKINEE